MQFIQNELLERLKNPVEDHNIHVLEDEEVRNAITISL